MWGILTRTMFAGPGGRRAAERLYAIAGSLEACVTVAALVLRVTPSEVLRRCCAFIGWMPAARWLGPDAPPVLSGHDVALENVAGLALAALTAVLLFRPAFRACRSRFGWFQQVAWELSAQSQGSVLTTFWVLAGIAVQAGWMRPAHLGSTVSTIGVVALGVIGAGGLICVAGAIVGMRFTVLGQLISWPGKVIAGLVAGAFLLAAGLLATLMVTAAVAPLEVADRVLGFSSRAAREADEKRTAPEPLAAGGAVVRLPGVGDASRLS